MNDNGSDTGCFYTYVPILDTLFSMLCDNKIREYCKKNHQEEGRVNCLM